MYEPGEEALATTPIDSDPSPDVICASPEVLTGPVSGSQELLAGNFSDVLRQVGAARVFGALGAVGSGRVSGALETV